MKADRQVGWLIKDRRRGMAKDSSFHRKLAAILAADVVGYSRMMEADEVGTLRQVQSVQRSCMTPITAAYGGRLIKTTGDGFLFEFSSAVDAILFAVDFQKKVLAAMAAVPEAKRIVFRVGVHAGDVLSDGLDMFGDGVNVASRLETLCAPGGICMSAVVQQQLHGKIELPLVDLGEYQVKNITRAIHVFGIEAAAIDLATPAGLGGMTAILKRRRPWVGAALGVLVIVLAATGWLVVRRITSVSGIGVSQQATQTFSIAVLPFSELNGDAKQNDFADALVDNLTTGLSIGLPSATVISSSSAFTYRGKGIDPRQVGRELGTKYILEGSVQRIADRLRVNVQLIEAASAIQLWSDQFDGAMSNLGDLQDQITAGIANTLQVHLVRIEADGRKLATDPSALDLILRGESIMTREFSFENFDLAEAAFRKALVAEPNNLNAMTDLGQLLAVRVGSGGTLAKGGATLEDARQLLERVRAQDPRHPGLHNSLGLVDLNLSKIREAAEHFRTEIDNDKNAASAYANLGLCLTLLGRPAEAIPLIEKSLRLNPRDPNISFLYTKLMAAYFALAQYPQAIEQGERAYSANPNNPELVYTLAALNALAGHQEDAKARLAEAIKLQPGLTVSIFRSHPGAQDATAVALTNRLCEGLLRAGLPE